METEIVKHLSAEYDERVQLLEQPRPLILTTRRFRRSGCLGTHIWRSVTRNFDLDQEIEHVEIACPNYKLTDRGPVLDRDKDEEE